MTRRVGVAVGVNVGLELCILRRCHCDTPGDARGLHGLVCERAPGPGPVTKALNRLVARSFASAGVAISKQPVCI